MDVVRVQTDGVVAAGDVQIVNVDEVVRAEEMKPIRVLSLDDGERMFFNHTAFRAPVNGTVGNVGRDTLTGPGMVDCDLSLLKVTQVTERAQMQFRAEVSTC